MTLLRFPPQVIGGQYLPLRIGIAQIQVCHFFRKVSLWVKSEIPRNELPPPARSIGQVDLARFVACQLMGRIFQEHSLPQSNPGGIQIDRKRLEELMEKREAHGLKGNVYEEYKGPTMSM